MPHNFWMINCNERNFEITRNLGFAQQGLKAEHRRKVQRVEPGDRVIYYVSGTRVFTATATVTKGYEEVRSTPWLNEGKTPWAYRIGIKPDVVLERAQYITAGLIAYRLEYLRKWPPEDWPLAFQGNLHLLSKGDFFLLESEMLKLRDGREVALHQIEQELQAEAERVATLRERRRRNAERDPARAARPRPTRPPNAPEPDPAAESESTESSAEQAQPGQPAGPLRGRPRGRNRRDYPARGRPPRRPAGPAQSDAPRHDRD